MAIIAKELFDAVTALQQCEWERHYKMMTPKLPQYVMTDKKSSFSLEQRLDELTLRVAQLEATSNKPTGEMANLKQKVDNFELV